jgi:hypothetical protein
MAVNVRVGSGGGGDIPREYTSTPIQQKYPHDMH